MISKISMNYIQKQSFLDCDKTEKLSHLNFGGSTHFRCEEIEKYPNFIMTCEYIRNWFMQFSEGIKSKTNGPSDFVMNYPKELNNLVEKFLAGSKYEKIFNTQGMKIEFNHNDLGKKLK